MKCKSKWWPIKKYVSDSDNHCIYLTTEVDQRASVCCMGLALSQGACTEKHTQPWLWNWGGGVSQEELQTAGVGTYSKYLCCTTGLETIPDAVTASPVTHPVISSIPFRCNLSLITQQGCGVVVVEVERGRERSGERERGRDKAREKRRREVEMERERGGGRERKKERRRDSEWEREKERERWGDSVIEGGRERLQACLTSLGSGVGPQPRQSLMCASPGCCCNTSPAWARLTPHAFQCQQNGYAWDQRKSTLKQDTSTGNQLPLVYHDWVQPNPQIWASVLGHFSYSICFLLWEVWEDYSWNASSMREMQYDIFSGLLNEGKENITWYSSHLFKHNSDSLAISCFLWDVYVDLCQISLPLFWDF